MQEKKKILIILDYLIGPIRASFDDQLMTGVPVIDEDDMLKELNLRIGDMYSGYYEFDSHGQGCRFDEERFRAEKGELLDLLGSSSAGSVSSTTAATRSTIRRQPGYRRCERK